MPPFTRRRALQGAVGLLAGFAGCNDGDPSGSPTPPARDRDGDRIARDPEYVTLRPTEYELGDRLAWFVDPADRPTDDGTVERRDREMRGLIADRATADTLTIDEEVVAETEVSESAEAVREFVAATDFDRETILLDPQLTYECYRLVLCHVSWTDDEYEVRYGRFLRDHDVACEAGARDGHLTVARIPAALDPETMEHGGTGVSNGFCRPPRGERDRPTPSGDATAVGTDAGAETDSGTGTPSDVASTDGGTQ